MHDNATKFGVRREHRMHQLGAIRLQKPAAGVITSPFTYRVKKARLVSIAIHAMKVLLLLLDLYIPLRSHGR